MITHMTPATILKPWAKNSYNMPQRASETRYQRVLKQIPQSESCCATHPDHLSIYLRSLTYTKIPSQFKQYYGCHPCVRVTREVVGGRHRSNQQAHRTGFDNMKYAHDQTNSGSRLTVLPPQKNIAPLGGAPHPLFPTSQVRAGWRRKRFKNNATHQSAVGCRTDLRDTGDCMQLPWDQHTKRPYPIAIDSALN